MVSRRRCMSLARLCLYSAVIYALVRYRAEWLPLQYPTKLPHLTIPTRDDLKNFPFPGRAGAKKEPEPQPDPEPKRVVKYFNELYNSDERCGQAPGLESVMVIFKTGATELYDKLPPHLVTTFRCLPNLVIFSDLEQDFAEYPIYNALSTVSQKVRQEHADFEHYRALQEYFRKGEDVNALRGPTGESSKELDKWKFLPMMHTATNSAEDDIKWFVVMEGDTSISWTNLMQLLARVDPTQPFYAGAQLVSGDTNFAHGGSGIIVSRKAADMLEQRRMETGWKEYDKTWEDHTSDSCCGDEVLGRAFLDAGVILAPTWPLIQGETIASLDWTDWHWCVPAISWHHMSAIEIDSIWQFESKWTAEHGNSTPYIFRDVFDTFVAAHVTSGTRLKWNNYSRDRIFVHPDAVEGEVDDWDDLQDYERDAVQSAEDCERACEIAGPDDCVQWLHGPGRCHLGNVVRLGSVEEHDDYLWTSGWMSDRIMDKRRSYDDCEVQWHA